MALRISLMLAMSRGNIEGIGVGSAMGQISTVEHGCSMLGHCHGNGVCHDGAEFSLPTTLSSTTNFTTAVCLCKPHWRGAECIIPTCPHGCNGRGVCLPALPARLLYKDGRSTELAWAALPKWRCACDAGWGGVDCGSRVCVANCSGHGWCTEENTCACSAGWTGPACDQRVCMPDSNCSGHGMCIEAKCHCAGGWQGSACELRACEQDCSGHGMCDASGSCVCDAGYGGVSCGELACPKECSGRGRCLSYGSPSRVCRCDPGWGGADCASRICPVDCGDRGACANGRCLCANGWGGEKCATSHCPNACSGHGTCGGHSCHCDDGWAGEDCSERGCVGGCPALHFCYDGSCACSPGHTGLGTAVCTLRTCASVRRVGFETHEAQFLPTGAYLASSVSRSIGLGRSYPNLKHGA